MSALPVRDVSHMAYSETPTAERARRGHRALSPDAKFLRIIHRWEALRWNGVPADQAAADVWYWVKDYVPRTAFAQNQKARFLATFPFVALKRSRIDRAAEKFERRNIKDGEKLCS